MEIPPRVAQAGRAFKSRCSCNAQVTRHIGPEVDTERELIMSGLKNAGWTEDEYFVDGFHRHLEGRNGGGDLWRTDGRLGAVVLKQDAPEAS